MLGAAPLAQGTVYLLLPRRVADRLTVLMLTYIAIASGFVAATPIVSEMVESHRLAGSVMEWQWVRLFSPLVNLYAVVFPITRVDGMSSRSYGTLSSGEQARVQIARVLAQDAPVALLDEPTASLDLANTELILSVLTEGLDEHHTTICVLHDLNAAAYYADRLVLMSQGEVAADGPPRTVLEPQLLSEVYEIAMTVIDHPTRGSPLVLPASSTPTKLGR